LYYFLDKLKIFRKRKNVKDRIIAKKDIENVIFYIYKAEQDELIDIFVVEQFAAYTGQCLYSTISRVTVGLLREALQSEKPVLHVRSSQDKIKMEHYFCYIYNLVKFLNHFATEKGA
jgi:hypothetical protein